MFCAECGAENMRRTDEAFVEHYKGEDIRISGVDHWVCDECGETVFSADDLRSLGKAANAEYRRVKGLLKPDEIRAVRKECGLSQQQFEQMLGVASPTVSRWETGSVIQSKPIDNLIRGIRDYKSLADDLMRRAKVTEDSGDAACRPSFVRAC